MSTPSNRFFDELAKVLSGAAGAAQGLRNEIDSLVKAQFERLSADMDLARREELEVVREMASKALRENEELKARIEALEARLGGSEKGAGGEKGDKSGESGR